MTIFSKIAAGEIPSYKCAENEDFYAFLDINPVAKGHTLVIPRREVDYIFDLDDETLAAYHRFAKRVALAIGEAFPCRKVGMAVLGLEVPHAHIHLIPLNNEGDMDFRKPKLQLPAEEMQAAADAIRAAFERQKPGLISLHVNSHLYAPPPLCSAERTARRQRDGRGAVLGRPCHSTRPTDVLQRGRKLVGRTS